MKNYINFLDKYKYILIILITVVVGAFSIFLKDLSFEGSYRIWFDKDSKIIKNYDLFRTTFSGDDTFIVAFKDENGIFTPKAIQTILELTEAFKAIDGIQKVDSLTNYQYISAIDDDLIIEDFIYDVNVNLKEKKELALQDRLIVNQLISKDGETTMLAVRLSSNVGTNEEVNIAVFKKLQEITNYYSSKSGYNFFISGTPAVTASLVTISHGDAEILMPLAVGIVVLLLFLLFRNFIGVFIPTIVVLFTFLIVLSIQVIAGYKLNNFTVNIPSFISAIAIAGSMHLFLSWAYYKMKVKSNKEAVYNAMKSNIIPIALTSFTTAVGFASLGVSKIEPISTLGLAITSGATLSFVFTITVAPAVLLMLKDNYRFQPPQFLNFLNTQGYGAFIVRNNKKILVSFILFFIIISYGLKDIKVDSNSIKYFAEKTVVRSGSDFVEKSLTGSMVYEIILNSKQKEGVKKPEFLHKIVQFEKAFKSKFENVRFTTSLKDIVVRMQKVLNPESADMIPKNQNLVAQYLLLYSMSLPQGMEINDKIDTTEQYLRLTINSNIVDTSKDLEMIKWIKKWWENNTYYCADVQGQTAIFAYMQSSITDTLIISISSTLIIVTLMMLLIFRNLKILWLFIVPNVAPVILVAGIMGYLGITIDIGIAISAAVILGIAVDDTVHFFSKFFDAIKTKSFEESIDYVISHSGNAMILTTFILSSTFLLFTVSDFIPNVHFAVVTVCALNIALLLDLVLLPALLSLFYNEKTYAS